nr:hypothetical protein Cry52Nrm2_p125 [Cryptomonas curvata]
MCFCKFFATDNSIYFKELNTTISGLFSLHSISICFINLFIIDKYQGKNTFTCQIFNNVWNIKWFDVKLKEKTFFLINTKLLNCNEKSWSGDFLELWEYSSSNNIKRKSIFYFPNVGEIWDFSCSNCASNKGLGSVIICAGFKIFLFNSPLLIPQFTLLIKGVCSISLINIYQWKMDCSCSTIVTGDIRGNLIIYNLFKDISIMRIFHNSNKNVPISIIKILLMDISTKKANFVISSGYDGTIKIWDLERQTNALVEIIFSKRWIIDIQWYSSEIYDSTFLISFENGFVSFWNILTGAVFNIKFIHQIAIWKTIQRYQIFISIGEDSDINMIEINSPFFLDLKYLLFFQNNKAFNKNFSNAKLGLNCLQSLKRNFFLGAIGISPSMQKEFLINLSGNAGILIFYKFKINL